MDLDEDGASSSGDRGPGTENNRRTKARAQQTKRQITGYVADNPWGDRRGRGGVCVPYRSIRVARSRRSSRPTSYGEAAAKTAGTARR